MGQPSRSLSRSTLKRPGSGRLPRMSYFQRRQHGKCADSASLLLKVWGLDSHSDVWSPSPYVEMYQSLFSRLDPSMILFPDRPSVLKDLDTVKDGGHLHISQIKENLNDLDTTRILSKKSDEAINQRVEFLIQLWLMVQPRQGLSSEPSFTLEDIVRMSLDYPSIEGSGPVPEFLSPDFKAKSLVRIGGFRIIYTSSLSEHLLCTSGHEVKVFVHASILRKYSKSSERKLYPDGFLEETLETLELLFPTLKIKDSQRTRRIRNRDNVDIEAARGLPPSIRLSHYKHWGKRLAMIQQEYDKARPKRYRQWWFDRRNRAEWATLFIAIIIFFMTLIFGVISSVTGIMQVYASFGTTH